MRHEGDSSPTDTSRPFGLKLIIGYKLVKAPLVLVLALFLTFNPGAAAHAAAVISRDLSEGGALAARVGRWLGMHVSRRDVHHATWLAWLDGLVTLAEGILLWRGHAWGEWIVVGALAALVPFEALSLERHIGALKLLVLALNIAIVAYLAARRIHETGRHRR